MLALGVVAGGSLPLMTDQPNSAQQRPEAQTAAGEDIPADSVSRFRLVLALARFQIKLLIDGLRDLVLSPIALVAVLVGIASPGDQPDRLFRRLLLWGRRSESWINLFGYRPKAGADDLLDPIEQALVREASSDNSLGRVNRAVNDGLSRHHRERRDKQAEPAKAADKGTATD